MEIPPRKAQSSTGFQQEDSPGAVSTSEDGAHLPAVESWLGSITLRARKLRNDLDPVPSM